MDAPLFVEKQKMTQWYIWIVPLAVLICILFSFISQLILDKPIGRPISLSELLIVSVVLILFLIFLRSVSLYTAVNENSIFIRLNPLTKRTILINDIAEMKVIKYKFVGFGLRLDTDYGTVYNIKGNTGLQIIKSDGEKILIGTQRGEELNQLVQQLPFRNRK